MLNPPGADAPHRYLSSACFHDQHDYCRGPVGLAGPKTPGVCHYCPAPCCCPCHTVRSTDGET